jgi:hypothetical protein
MNTAWISPESQSIGGATLVSIRPKDGDSDDEGVDPRSLGERRIKKSVETS